MRKPFRSTQRDRNRDRACGLVLSTRPSGTRNRIEHLVALIGWEPEDGEEHDQLGSRGHHHAGQGHPHRPVRSRKSATARRSGGMLRRPDVARAGPRPRPRRCAGQSGSQARRSPGGSSSRRPPRWPARGQGNAPRRRTRCRGSTGHAVTSWIPVVAPMMKVCCRLVVESGVQRSSPARRCGHVHAESSPSARSDAKWFVATCNRGRLRRLRGDQDLVDKVHRPVPQLPATGTPAVAIKVHMMLALLLSGAMRWDVLRPWRQFRRPFRALR